MLSCWHHEPASRPSFSQLSERVESMLNSDSLDTYISTKRQTEVAQSTGGGDTVTYTWLQDSDSDSDDSTSYDHYASVITQQTSFPVQNVAMRPKTGVVRMQTFSAGMKKAPQNPRVAALTSGSDSCQASCPNLSRSLSVQVRGSEQQSGNNAILPQHNRHQAARRTNSATSQGSARSSKPHYEWKGNV